MICRELGEPLRVLDLYAGEGWMWKKLRQSLKIAAYTPVDIRPRQAGTIRMNVTGRSVLGFNPDRFNVIDIDTYGDPWEVWEGLRRRITRRSAVFITNGIMGRGEGSLSLFLRAQAGIPHAWPLPVNEGLIRYLGRCYFVRSLAGLKVERALYMEHPHVDYYGMAAISEHR
jgi:hypothetical protein